MAFGYNSNANEVQFWPQYVPSPLKLEGVPIAKEAWLQTPYQEIKLGILGKGIREKEIFLFISVNVYVAQMFSSSPFAFIRSRSFALSSLKSMKAVAMSMTFLRDVELDRVLDSWETSLEANNVDITKPEIKFFLDSVKNGGKARKGKSFVLIGERLGNGTEAITYQSSEKSYTIFGAEDFIQSIFSVWFGKNLDSDLDKLRTQILIGK